MMLSIPGEVILAGERRKNELIQGEENQVSVLEVETVLVDGNSAARRSTTLYFDFFEDSR